MTAFIEGPVSRSTQWARENKEKVALWGLKKKGVLSGKAVYLITNSRHRCKKSGLEHSIDSKFIVDMFNKQNGRCALSNLEMTIQGKRGTDEYWHSVSLDRIDSSKGYIPDNVQLVCTGVNYMKKDMSDEMFINFCREVVKTNG